VKINECVVIIFSKDIYEDDGTITTKFDTCKFYVDFVFINESEINEKLINATDEYMEKIDGNMHIGSGWAVHSFKCMYLNIVGYQPTAGSSYIALPKEIAEKEAIINPKNEDQHCFLYAVGIGLYKQYVDSKIKHIERLPTVLKDYCKNINLDGVESPVMIDNRIFKKVLNQNEFTFNIYAYENYKEYNETVEKLEDKKPPIIYPVFVVSQVKAKHVNLFYFSELDASGETVSHYTYITDMNRLLASLSNHKEKSCLHACIGSLGRIF